jgi:GT2 family glycosyltransferase
LLSSPSGVSDPIQIPRSGAPRVSIVIPSAADPQLLFACLRALERHLPASIPTETIVVLDGALEGAAARVEAAAPGARVVASSVRLGLARSGNRGRRMARGEFIALLHDDSEIEHGWLEALVSAAEEHPEAGAFGGLVLFPDGTPQTAGVVLYRDGTAVPPWTGAPPPPESFDRPRAADFCASNALLVRAEAWDAVGGLDERFFPAYFVDADLAMGLREAGWSVLFEPRARSRHRRGGSSRKEFREWVSARNRAPFLAKWREALAAHEPWDKGSPETVVRALARAEALATRLGARADGRVPGPAPATADAALEEKRSLEQDLALHRAYAKCLEENLAAIQDLRWWRIYRRLLPVLEPLVAALRRLSRPGSSSRTG